MISVGLFYTGSLKNGWCNVTDVMILVANFTFTLNSIWPVNNQSICLATTVFGLFKVAERGIACHRPTCVIMWISVPLPPPFQIAHARIERGLQTIEYVCFVKRSGQSAFTTGTVVRGDKN